MIEEDGCQELSKVVGGYLLERLTSLRDEFECVGDVRGKGLMVGLELVQDKACTFCSSLLLTVRFAMSFALFIVQTRFETDAIKLSSAHVTTKLVLYL